MVKAFVMLAASVATAEATNVAQMENPEEEGALTVFDNATHKEAHTLSGGTGCFDKIALIEGGHGRYCSDNPGGISRIYRNVVVEAESLNIPHGRPEYWVKVTCDGATFRQPKAGVTYYTSGGGSAYCSFKGTWSCASKFKVTIYNTHGKNTLAATKLHWKWERVGEDLVPEGVEIKAVASEKVFEIEPAIQDTNNGTVTGWDCNCKGTYDVCSLTTCRYKDSCTGSDVLTMPNVHPETETVGAEAGDHSWRCNCNYPYSWCSYTTCYKSCHDHEDLESEGVEIKAVASEKFFEIEPAIQDTNNGTVTGWDCNCKGTFDVCSSTTCRYANSCGGSEVLTMPNVHSESVTGDHSWHCNCDYPYSWCSYTTCYKSCHDLQDSVAEGVEIKMII